MTEDDRVDSMVRSWRSRNLSVSLMLVGDVADADPFRGMLFHVTREDGAMLGLVTFQDRSPGGTRQCLLEQSEWVPGW